MMASDESGTRIVGLPDINATSGIPLMKVLDRWKEAIFQAYHNVPIPEEMLIKALKASAGKEHPIYVLVTCNPNDPSLDYKTPEQFYQDIARRNAHAHVRKVEAYELGSMPVDHLAEVLKELKAYPAYQASPALWRTIAQLEAEAEDGNTSAFNARRAQRQLADLERTLDAERTEHDMRTPAQQLTWLIEQGKHELATTANNFAESRARKEHSKPKNPDVDRIRRLTLTPFNSIEDMKGLCGICDYVLLKLGSMNHLNVKAFRALRIRPNQNPRQAYTNALRDAELLTKSKVQGFDMWLELFNLVTPPELDGGGCFFSKPLHANIDTVCRTLLSGVESTDYEKHINVYVEQAEIAYGRHHGTDTSIDREINAAIQAQHKGKGSLNGKAADNKGSDKPADKAKGGGGASGSGTQNQRNRGRQQSGGKWCPVHNTDTHDLLECRDTRAFALQKHKDSGATGVFTFTSGPGTNPLDSGMRPNTGYGRATGNQAAADKNNSRRNRNIKCEHCTKHNGGEPVYHAPGCYLNGEKPMPRDWQPSQPKLLKACNLLRQKLGWGPVRPRGRETNVTVSTPAGNLIARVVNLNKGDGDTFVSTRWGTTR